MDELIEEFCIERGYHIGTKQEIWFDADDDGSVYDTLEAAKSWLRITGGEHPENYRISKRMVTKWEPVKE